MRPFEYARPETEGEALELLAEHGGNTAVLAGGTDLMNLLKRDVIQPARVVDIKNVSSWRGIKPHDGGVMIGANTTLDEINEHAIAADYRSLIDVIDGIRAIQITANGTLVGDLCQLPHCWYFRNGYGLLAMKDGESLVATGDNRYHAILGNSGPAKFVSASRFAPPAIAWDAKVRIVTQAVSEGTATNGVHEEWLPLEYFFLTPKTNGQGVTVLKPGQLITHLWLPAASDTRSATYEVLELNGLDQPQASAACCLGLDGGIVRHAKIVLGHVAPTPWIAHDAAKWLVGQQLTSDVAETVGRMALAKATPLSHNDFKVQMAQAAVERALLKATNQLGEVL
ncbi:MAG: FAD binding domain-containing protein [Planctomycetaceae bacterium]|nr:FAD binding domain-containing protein [Planctomycetaceae bacterium]